MFLKRFFMTCSIVALCIVSLNAQAADIVKLNTLDWEPYIGEKMDGNGFVAALVREAFTASGYTVEFTFQPWVRAKATAKDGKADGCLPEYYLQEDQADFLISEPFPGGPLGFMKRKADNIAFSKLEDLKSLKIGVVRGYVNTEDFDKADYLQKEESNDDITNLRKLLAGRLDLVVIDKFVGLYLIQQEIPDKVGEIEFVSPALEEKTLHVLISKKTANADAKMQAFNDGLKKMRDSGRLDELMKNNGF